MVFLKNLLSRFVPSTRRSAPSPDNEDVDMDWLNLKGGADSLGGEGDGPAAALAAGGVRNKPFAQGKVEPDFSSDRPPAAIPVSERELQSIQSGSWAGQTDEREELLQQLNELGFNLKRVMNDVFQIQKLVATDFDSLSDDDKREARVFIDGLSALVVRDEPDQQAA
jgi:hypothetical protein